MKIKYLFIAIVLSTAILCSSSFVDAQTTDNSVLIAQKENAEIKTASSNKYVVSMRKGSAEVDLSNGTSTSEKFTKGNYADFGIADEYIVSAADQVSPYLRLKRALSD